MLLLPSRRQLSGSGELPDSQLNPNREATRAEVAAFVYQALVNAGRRIQSPYVVSLPSGVREEQGGGEAPHLPRAFIASSTALRNSATSLQ